MALARRSGRRRGAGLVVALAAALAAPLLGTSPAAADVDRTGVRAVTTQTAAVVPGQTAWLSVVWTSDQTVTNWSTTVSAPAGVTVSYPTTRGGADTSLYGSESLVGSTRDFTAFKLQVPYTQRTSFPLTVVSTYTSTCGDNGQCKEVGGGNDDKARDFSTTVTVTVPVVPATGPDFIQDTTSLTVPASSDAFAQLAFSAGQADLADFTVRAGRLPAGLVVGYPGDAPASRPAGGAALIGRSTDQVALRLDTTGMARGTYTLPLVISYTAATPRTASGTVTLVVQ
ncbi:hypothetical protein [Blastococcus haudaquaticus]|uniref:Uncharacterized protein n=1 Tax=Blastococcus haudaquaticus TaxID=1938745 RepID=A0A286GXA9_9ACTN|nr:hypothetical protein [Blastococcus haudaquaticus]SOE00187.1 hypothetical protein SAMN06272739_2443 [Blastococcus haudaquaticus]